MSKVKIISGGQTGVDQGALDFALDHHFACGGYCPKGRISELGVIPYKYPLIELDSEDHIERTQKNVIESDGTLIIEDDEGLKEGSMDTIQFCNQLFKPVLIIHVDSTINAGYKFRRWMVENKIRTLNVAGNKQSESPGIHGRSYLLLIKLFDI